MEFNNNDNDAVVSTPINPPRVNIVSQSQHASVATQDATQDATQQDDSYSFFTCDDHDYQSPVINDDDDVSVEVIAAVPSPDFNRREIVSSMLANESNSSVKRSVLDTTKVKINKKQKMLYSLQSFSSSNALLHILRKPYLPSSASLSAVSIRRLAK